MGCLKKSGAILNSVLNDGSMEATLLFIETGRKLLSLAKRHGWWKQVEIGQYEIICGETENQFRHNFLREQGFITNNPVRGQMPGMPWFRHGVCEKCHSIEWTQKNNHGRYTCPACYPSDLTSVESETIEVHSAGLLPTFIHSAVMQENEKAMGILKASGIFQNKGYLPSVEGQNRFVGYDVGLLLYGLIEIKHASAKQVYEHILKIVDSAGAWVEYYEEGKSQGCRCRPWESGMNIAAVLHYWKQGESSR